MKLAKNNGSPLCALDDQPCPSQERHAYFVNPGSRDVARHHESEKTIRHREFRRKRLQRYCGNGFEQGIERFIEQRSRHTKSSRESCDSLGRALRILAYANV